MSPDCRGAGKTLARYTIIHHTPSLPDFHLLSPTPPVTLRVRKRVTCMSEQAEVEDAVMEMERTVLGYAKGTVDFGWEF